LIWQAEVTGVKLNLVSIPLDLATHRINWHDLNAIWRSDCDKLVVFFHIEFDIDQIVILISACPISVQNQAPFLG